MLTDYQTPYGITVLEAVYDGTIMLMWRLVCELAREIRYGFN